MEETSTTNPKYQPSIKNTLHACNFFFHCFFCHFIAHCFVGLQSLCDRTPEVFLQTPLECMYLNLDPFIGFALSDIRTIYINVSVVKVKKFWA